MQQLATSIVIALSLLALVQTVPAPARKSSRIFGGEEAEPHSIPYMVYIYTVYIDDETTKANVLSDGVLITTTAVLTTVDPFFSEPDFLRVELYLGAHEVLEPIPDSVTLRITNRNEVIIHPNFTLTDNSINNIAICRFREPVELSDIINVIPVPFDPSNDYVGDLATVSGWGGYEEDDIISNVLRKIEVYVMSNDECDSRSDSVLCTSGDGGKSVCTVDKGGPLVSSSGELIGIVISKWPCFGAAQFRPSFYTRITSHLRWIAQNI